METLAEDGINVGTQPPPPEPEPEPGTESTEGQTESTEGQTEPAAEPIEAHPEMPEFEPGYYDPADHTVVEVQEYLAQHPEQREQILAAERSGKNRATLVGAEHEETP